MSRNGENVTRIDRSPVLAAAVAAGLLGVGFAALACCGLALLGVDPATDRPGVGSEVVVVADPSSTYTRGHSVLVTDRLLSYEELGRCLRAGDAAGAERVKSEGTVLALAPGDRLVIVNELGMVGDTYVARVLFVTGIPRTPTWRPPTRG